MQSMDAPTASNRTWTLQRAIQQGIHDSGSVPGATEDLLVWQWSNNCEYSAKSAYDVLISGGQINWKYTFIWHLKIPPSSYILLFTS